MNALDNVFLKMVLLPRRMYTKMHVNVHQLECILLAKLEIDDRTPSSMMKLKRRNPNKEVKNVRWTDFFVNGAMGFLMGIGVLFGDGNHREISFFYFLMLTVLLTITSLSGLAEILLSGKDNFIILPRPVNNETVALSRNLHVLIRILTLALPIFLPGVIIVLTSWNPIQALGLLIGSLSCCFFSAFIVSVFYLILMRLFSPKRLASILGMLQVIAFVCIYLGFQIVPRFLGSSDDRGINFSIPLQDWMLVLPSYWNASVVQFFSHGTMNTASWIGFALTFVSPFIFIFILLKFLAPSFANSLYKINGAIDQGTLPKKSLNEKKRKANLKQFFSRILTKKGQERSAFVFAWNVSGRMREFKTKVYPMMGYVIFYAILIGGIKKGHLFSVEDLKIQSSYGKRIVLGSVYSLFVLSIAIAAQMRVTENFKASWLYYTMPIDKPGKTILGAYKGLLTKYCMPFIVIVSTIFISIVGPKVILNLVLGYANVLLVSLMMLYGKKNYLPFSIFENNISKTGDFVRTMLQMILISFLGIGQFFIYDFYWAESIVLLLVLGAIWYVATSIREISWSKIVVDNI